jgi:hypothetical protein
MPLLPHHVPGEKFDIMQSQAVRWLINCPEIRQDVWNWLRRMGVIEFDIESGCWRGVAWSGHNEVQEHVKDERTCG